MEKKLNVGITHGDVNGISYELIIKLLMENRLCDVCVPILYGSPKVAAYYRKNLAIEGFSLNPIREPSAANAKRSNVINCLPDDLNVEIGRETDESDKAAMLALQSALGHLDDHQIDAVVAAPQGSKSFQLAAAAHLVDFLGKRYDRPEAMTIAVSEKMRLGFVTEHGRYRDVPQQITQRNVGRKLGLLNHALRIDFMIQKPKIAVLALNSLPREGQDEEANVLLPVIDRARQNGIMALGPFAADTFFASGAYEKFDGVLAMYHDQAMPAFEAMAAEGKAAYVAGLPGVCAFPLQQPDYHLVGQVESDEQGLRNAVYLAIDVASQRARSRELQRDPLPHYNVAGNSNESDLNVEQIEGVKEEVGD